MVCRGTTCNVIFEDVFFTHTTLVATEGATVTIMHAKFNNLPAHAPTTSTGAQQSAPNTGHFSRSVLEQSLKQGASVATDGTGTTSGSPRVTPRAPPPKDRVAIYAYGAGTKVTAGDVTIRGGMQVCIFSI